MQKEHEYDNIGRQTQMTKGSMCYYRPNYYLIFSIVTWILDYVP